MILSDSFPSGTPRIAIANLPSWTRPPKSPFRYPSYADDFGIEQDFLEYLQNHYPATVQDVGEADYLYIPVFWTRLHLQNGYGKFGLVSLQEALRPVINHAVKKFTVCAYDDGPIVDLQDTQLFLGSRRDRNGSDVPLLATPLPQSFFHRNKVKRHIRASFSGRLNTHPSRQELFAAAKGYQEIHLSSRTIRPRRYAALLEQSQVALSPRGYGGSSFRFFEALQMGAVPWLIGDQDVRPFKSQIDWESISFYSESVEEFIQGYKALSDLEIDQKLDNVRTHSKHVWRLGAWCHMLIRELTSLP